MAVRIIPVICPCQRKSLSTGRCKRSWKPPLTFDHDVVFECDGRRGADVALVDVAVLLADAVDGQDVAQLSLVLQHEPAVRAGLEVGREEGLVAGLPQDDGLAWW